MQGRVLCSTYSYKSKELILRLLSKTKYHSKKKTPMSNWNVSSPEKIILGVLQLVSGHMTTSTALPIFWSIVSSKHHQLLITDSPRALKQPLKQSGNKLSLRLISSNRGGKVASVKVKLSLTNMSFRLYGVCRSCVPARQRVPAHLAAGVVHRVAVGHHGEPPWWSVATWLLRHQSACQ